MSDLFTVAPPGTSSPTLGLSIINEQPVQVSRATPTSPVVVTGSAGRDIIQPTLGQTTSYTIDGGAGDDQISGALGNDRISGGTGNDQIFSGGGNDTLSGGDGDDTVNGGAGGDRISAGDGIDFVIGGGGNDTINGDQGNDILLGGPGNDQIFGNAGADVLRGGDGNDTLDGGPGPDTLIGGPGNDLLISGTGRDVLKGGFGRDTFRFNPGSTGAGGVDRIVDFNPEQDKIELSRALLPGSGLQRGKLSSEQFAVVEDLSSVSTKATLIYEQKSGILYYNPGSGKDVPLLQLNANLSDISASNFTIR
jgi:Ca2+-binding RTX toxin-like protein